MVAAVSARAGVTVSAVPMPCSAPRSGTIQSPALRVLQLVPADTAQVPLRFAVLLRLGPAGTSVSQRSSHATHPCSLALGRNASASCLAAHRPRHPCLGVRTSRAHPCLETVRGSNSSTRRSRKAIRVTARLDACRACAPLQPSSLRERMARQPSASDDHRVTAISAPRLGRVVYRARSATRVGWSCLPGPSHGRTRAPSLQGGVALRRTPAH